MFYEKKLNFSRKKVLIFLNVLSDLLSVTRLTLALHEYSSAATITELSCLVSKMSENGEKCGSVFPKVQDNVHQCLVFSKDIQFPVPEERRN